MQIKSRNQKHWSVTKAYYQKARKGTIIYTRSYDYSRFMKEQVLLMNTIFVFEMRLST